MIPIVRANTPNGFNPTIHTVTKFKKDNYDGDYTLNKDNLFQYNGENADYLYTHDALLGLSNFTVVEYELKPHLKKLKPTKKELKRRKKEMKQHQYDFEDWLLSVGFSEDEVYGSD